MSIRASFHRLLGFVCFWGVTLLPIVSLSGQSLSIQQAISKTLEHAPALKAAQAEAEQYQHLSDHRSVIQNPTVAFEAENVGGSDEYTGTDAAEYTLSIEKSFELGGKRKFRKNLSNIDQQEFSQRAERKEELWVAETLRRFYQLLIAQKKAELAQRQLETAQHAAEAVRTRQEVGSANILEMHRMDISVSLANIRYDESVELLQSAKLKLVSLWNLQNSMGVGEVGFDSAEGELVVPAEIPTLVELQQELRRSLSWRMNELELDRKEMLVEMEKSHAYPDLTMSVGRRWLRADDAEAWNVGVAVDLPIFNRNQHSVKAAVAATRQSHHQVAANRQALNKELLRVHTALGIAWRKHQNLEDNALSKAKETYRLVSEGFELGRYELLYLLEAQQTLFEIESTLLDSVSDFFEASADLYEILADGTPTNLILQ